MMNLLQPGKLVVQEQNNLMSNVSSSDDTLNNSINSNVVDEEGTTTLDVHKTMSLMKKVLLHGLPFNCTDADIFKFFTGLEIVDLLLVNKSGRFSSEAFVVLSPTSAGGYIGTEKPPSYRVEVGYDSGYYDKGYRRSPSRSWSKKEKGKDQTEYTEILKLQGLPFNAMKDEIVEFFKDYRVVKEKVHIACRPDGKVSGDAYVTFETAEVAKQALCKDRLMIG
ncbi:putative RNA recognition motif domain, nucleotide-binding alpha-beta plait domain superfamily [Helianthus debilis subsp. tardiflorus]